jgi:hypothetical protein
MDYLHPKTCTGPISFVYFNNWSDELINIELYRIERERLL